MSRCPQTEIHQSRGIKVRQVRERKRCEMRIPFLETVTLSHSGTAIKETFKSSDNGRFYSRFNLQYHIRNFRWKKFWQENLNISHLTDTDPCCCKFSKRYETNDGVNPAENDCIEIGAALLYYLARQVWLGLFTFYFYNISLWETSEGNVGEK